MNPRSMLIPRERPLDSALRHVAWLSLALCAACSGADDASERGEDGPGGPGAEPAADCTTAGNCPTTDPTAEGATTPRGNTRGPTVGGDLRTDITFDWPEAAPAGAVGPCEAGTYSGIYEGMFSGAAVPPTPVSGPLNFFLSESRNGEFLEISDGTYVADFAGVITVNAPMAGSLDCATGEFNGRAMGTWLAVGLPGGPFDVTFAGVLDPATRALNGVIISVSNAGDLDGTFSATWTP